MSDENIKDVNEDLETSSEESTEENLEEKGKDVPYDRFSKVIEERNRLREEAEELKAKQEELAKTLNPEPEVKEEAPKSDSLSREDAILYAKGFSEEEVAYANKVAQLEGVNAIEASENALFTSWKAKRDEDTANNAAQLGASTASAPHKVETFKPNMTAEEHKALWKQQTQR